MDAKQTGGVVVLNVGSSSLKFGLFQAGAPILQGSAEFHADSPYQIQIHDASGKSIMDRAADCKAPRDLTHIVLESIRSLAPAVPIAAYGHRVVHGGSQYTGPVRITDEVLAELEKLTDFAPLHQPHTIKTIRDLQKMEPEVPQVACFDTAFHATMPKPEKMFGLPHSYFDEGVRRYGFHGLAFESVVEQLRTIDPELAEKRIVACHLGSGSSICGIRGGQSIATTMGCTPLDGLLMGTRCGRLDPGILLYLQHRRGMSSEQVSDMLYHQSGLLGISGISADMRKLLVSEERKAIDAVELFCHMAVREIGSIVALLGGIDALVFSGGIGENAHAIRVSIAGSFAWLGLELNLAANVPGKISAEESAAPIFVLAAQEEIVVARQTAVVAGLEAT